MNNYFEIYWIILKNPQKFYTKPKRFINWTKMSLLRLEFVFWYTAPSLLRTFLTSFLSPIFSLSFFVLWSEVTKIFLCSVPRMLFTLVVQLYGKAPPLRISTPIKVDVFQQKLNTENFSIKYLSVNEYVRCIVSQRIVVRSKWVIHMWSFYTVITDTKNYNFLATCCWWKKSYISKIFQVVI